MIGGQVADVESVGIDDITVDDVRFIHERKTARLINASLEMGAVSAGISAEKLNTVREFGGLIGLAFQIVDDILDIESSNEVLGKNVGSDEESDKATYPKVCGLAESKRIAIDMITDAEKCISTLGEDTRLLRDMANFVINRVN
jgi:geranylgeranyl diphosphate synthase type II